MDVTTCEVFFSRGSKSKVKLRHVASLNERVEAPQNDMSTKSSTHCVKLHAKILRLTQQVIGFLNLV